MRKFTGTGIGREGTGKVSGDPAARIVRDLAAAKAGPATDQPILTVVPKPGAGSNATVRVRDPANEGATAVRDATIPQEAIRTGAAPTPRPTPIPVATPVPVAAPASAGEPAEVGDGWDLPGAEPAPGEPAPAQVLDVSSRARKPSPSPEAGDVLTSSDVVTGEEGDPFASIGEITPPPEPIEPAPGFGPLEEDEPLYGGQSDADRQVEDDAAEGHATFHERTNREDQGEPILSDGPAAHEQEDAAPESGDGAARPPVRSARRGGSGFTGGKLVWALAGLIAGSILTCIAKKDKVCPDCRPPAQVTQPKEAPAAPDAAPLKVAAPQSLEALLGPGKKGKPHAPAQKPAGAVGKCSLEGARKAEPEEVPVKFKRNVQAGVAVVSAQLSGKMVRVTYGICPDGDKGVHFKFVGVEGAGDKTAEVGENVKSKLKGNAGTDAEWTLSKDPGKAVVYVQEVAM